MRPGARERTIGGSIGFEATPSWLVVVSLLIEASIATAFPGLVLPASAKRSGP